jgi:hypothetical protein
LISWQVAHHQAVDPDRNGVGIVGVAVLGQQHCIDVQADVYLWSLPPADHAPEICLAIRLAHYFKVLMTFQKRSLQRALVHPRRAILLVHRPELRGSCWHSWPGAWGNVRGRRGRSGIQYPQLPARRRRAPRRIGPPPRRRSPPRRRRRPVGRRVEPHGGARWYGRRPHERCLTKHSNPLTGPDPVKTGVSQP